jgi:hypothetical protein
MARDIVDGDDVPASTTQLTRHALTLYDTALPGRLWLNSVYRTARRAWQFLTRGDHFIHEIGFFREIFFPAPSQKPCEGVSMAPLCVVTRAAAKTPEYRRQV